MEDKKCTGDCLRCGLQQQVYCAAQHGHAIYAGMARLSERLTQIEASLVALASADGIINPIKDSAQGGAGADNRAPIV